MPAAYESVTSRRLGPYLLGRRLGTGGMAAVYAARRENEKDQSAHVKRLVALKVLSPAVGREDPDHRAFMREALLATRLEHPNIVRTYDVGEHDGTLYIAMELIHGASISACQKAAAAGAPLRVALRIGLDLARGLHAAHELADPERGLLGVVHQDVSPQNVLLAYDGSVKLVDFGVARFAAIEGSRTESLRGKAAYASPEQLAGKNIDRRTDVFALGVLLWELFAGRRLFRKENNAATYIAILQEPIPRLSSVNGQIPESIADVVERALDRDRETRFATAEELAQALSIAASRSGTGWAENSEIADWVTKLVPPRFSPASLEREIVSPSSGRRDLANEVSGQHPAGFAARVDSIVPDLDLPVAPVSARISRPTVPIVSAAPPPSDDDDFDMQIERDGAYQIMSAPPSAPARPSMASSPRISHVASIVPSVSSAPSGLDVAYRRSASFKERAADDDEPTLRARAVGYAIASTIFLATGGLLFKVAHRSGGLGLAALIPHAFDGTSAVQSGAVALALLVAVVVLGSVGFRLRPRSWLLVAATIPTLLASLAMVTVTLVASEEQPSPADGAMLIPYVLPIGLLLLAIGLVGRAGKLCAAGSVGRKFAGAPLAAIGGAIAFFALETSAVASLLR